MTTELETAAESPGEYVAEEGGPLDDLPTPEPVPDLQAYLRERRVCLSRSSERLRNYLVFQRADRRRADVSHLPVRMDFENVSRCNFHCTMCQVGEWEKGQRASDMPVEAFRRLIDDLPGLVEIKVQGLGEPTLQRDAYFEMIRHARARHIWVRTTTNASLLHLHDNHRKLIDSDVNEVQVSFDGADKETFEGIRRGSVFERVRENCRLLNDYCEDQGVERTKMWTVVQKANRHQLPALVDLAAEMGFRNMAFALNLVDFGIERWRRVNDAVTVEREFSRAEAMDLVARGDRRGVAVRFWRVTRKYRADAPETLCPWPFERAYVSSDLRVVPCCVIGNPDVSELGDAANFRAVWFGPRAGAFRQAHLSGRIPPECRSCYENEGRTHD